jgi:hypothetical protein
LAKPLEPSPVKLFSSLFTKEGVLIQKVLGRLEKQFGKIDFLSEMIEFKHTDYYRDEFGGGLFRKIVSFENLIRPDIISSVKLFTNNIEGEYTAKDGKRMINIDPGYIALEKVVLTSCKNFSHRLYLRDGIYAELTLIYKKNEGYIPLNWTFPDYAEKNIKNIMLQIRKRYNHQLKLDTTS